jgi:hypothetical protein
MIKYKELFLEELTTAQKKAVDFWGPPTKGREISSHVMPHGSDRTDIEYKSSPHEISRVEPDHRIDDHIKKHGYEIKDYTKGTATDKHGRETTIGRILNRTKAPDEIQKSFVNDPSRSGAHLANMKVTVSRHPYDVAGMSTGRGWTSCMDMKCADKVGNQSETLKDDVSHGTHAAYLVGKDDNNIDSPKARIALKPFVSEDGKHTILRPEHKVYGISTRVGGDAKDLLGGKHADDLHHTVSEWAKKQFPMKHGVLYTKHGDVYDDDGITHHFDDSDSSVEKILKSADKNTKTELAHINNDTMAKHLANDDDDHVRKIVARKTKNTDTLKKLAKDGSHEVRKEVASRGDKDVNEGLLDDAHPGVHAAIIASRTHPELEAHYAATSRSPMVLKAVAEHSRNPDVLKELMYHENDNIANAAHASHAEATMRKDK